MAATSRSFSRATPSSPTASPTPPLNPGIKLGANGVSFVSSGIPDLDKILGGGFALGSLVMIMEDEDAPHHLLLLRNFMSQGIVHRQPVLFGSPLKDPRAFLGTLPSPLSSSSSKDDKLRLPSGVDSGQKEQEKNLRIAWQYKKYFGDQHAQEQTKDVMQDFSLNFDLRKPLERQFLNPQYVDCMNFQDTPDLQVLQDRCFRFLSNLSRNHGGSLGAGRIAIQSLCSPQCRFSERDWDMVSVIKSLRAMIKSSNAVAVITFPTSFLPPSFLKRWQHLADTLLSVKAIPDEDKDLAKLLTGYQDMLGLLHVHKIAQINTQVPTVLEASTYSLKLLKRRSLVLELLNQAPVDGSSGTSYATTSSCSGSSNNSLEF